MQAVAPTALEKKPAAQSAQADKPGAEAKVPFGHTLHSMLGPESAL